MIEQLRTAPLFASLPEPDLARLATRALERRLSAGDRLFDEGDPGESAFLIVSGELEILKRTAGERDVVLAVRGAGDIVGEMSLLENAPRSATARARGDVILLDVPKAALDDILISSPAAARSLVGVVVRRWKETEARMRQREQLAQLGTLAAGVAHELNNPAAAIERSAARFEEAAQRLAEARGVLARHATNRDALETLSDRIAAAPSHRLGALERRDREEELTVALTSLAAEGVRNLARALVDVESAAMDTLIDQARALDDPGVGAALAAGAAARQVGALVGATREAAARISAIVDAVRSFTYLDRGPVQEVDIHRALDDTLTLLSHRLGDIEVVREYGEVPIFPAHGSELNQVWTNLLTNAADAVEEAGRSPGRITIRTRVEDDSVIVEVEDDGAGIPPEVLPRIFDSFFTTKPPGQGTGLGLDISFGIVVDRHGGDITADSEPGRTTLRVELPLSGPDTA